MKIYQLWYEKSFSKQESPRCAIQKAVHAFLRNPGLRGLTPTGIDLNPSQINGHREVTVMDLNENPFLLPIRESKLTLVDHIMICHQKVEREPT